MAKMTVGAFNLKVEKYPSLTEKPDALPSIANAIKQIGKVFRNMEKRQKAKFLQNHQDWNQYLKDLSKSLEQSETLSLYKYPSQLMGLLIDLYKIDESLITKKMVSVIAEHQMSKVTNLNVLFLNKCASFFSKVNFRDTKFWSIFKEYLTPGNISKMSVSELTNLMWSLSLVNQLSEDIFSKLNSLVLVHQSNELNFTDLAILANLYMKVNDKNSLVALSNILLNSHQKVKNEFIVPRSISNIFWAFASVQKLIKQEVWTLIIKEYLLKYSKEFVNPRDIAQVLITANKIKAVTKQLGPKINQSLEEVCKRLVVHYVSQVQGLSEEAKINEQDLCNIFFAALNLDSVPQEHINLLTRRFVDNLEIIKPLGIGYCLHALLLKQKDLFNEHSDKILKFLESYQGITKENIGHLFWVLEQLPNSQSEKITNRFVELIQSNANKLFDVSNFEQFCQTFHVLQILGTLKATPNVAELLIGLFLGINPNNIRGSTIFEYSLFYLSLMLHSNYNVPAPENSELRVKLIEVTLKILKNFDVSFDSPRGFGNLVLSTAKSDLSSQELWDEILSISSKLNFVNMDITESLYLLKGLETYGKCEDLLTELKERFCVQVLSSLSLEKLAELMNKEALGKLTVKLLNEELKELLENLKSDERNKDQEHVIGKMRELL